MKNFFLELRMIKPDTISLIVVNTVVPLLNIMIYIRNIDFGNGMSNIDPLKLLFGTIQDENWMYWVFFSIGYIILIQIIWRPRERHFEYNIILSQQRTDLLWINRIIIGGIFTIIYIISSILFAIYGLKYFNIHFHLNIALLFQYLSIYINFYLHALLWLCLKVYISAQIANIVLLSLFFAGIKISEPYLPLYFSMISNIENRWLIPTLFSEGVVIFLLCYLIFLRAKHKDYF